MQRYKDDETDETYNNHKPDKEDETYTYIATISQEKCKDSQKIRQTRYTVTTD